MKKRKLLLLPLITLILMGCSTTTSIISSSTSLLSSSKDSTSKVESSTSEDAFTTTSSASSSIVTSSSSEVISSSSENKSSEETNEPIPSQNELLPINNRSVSGPLNKDHPTDISSWVNYDMHSSLPSDWAYIQGNNKIKNCFDFYQNEKGGFQFRKLYYGLQTPVFTSFKKVEVRFRISQFTNNSKKRDDGAPIFHIYGYDINGHHILTQYLEQGAITVSKEGTEIKIYIRDTKVRYLEFRLNAFPYKGSQCYNFGIDQFSLKGWDYE